MSKRSRQCAGGGLHAGCREPTQRGREAEVPRRVEVLKGVVHAPVFILAGIVVDGMVREGRATR